MRHDPSGTSPRPPEFSKVSLAYKHRSLLIPGVSIIFVVPAIRNLLATQSPSTGLDPFTSMAGWQPTAGQCHEGLHQPRRFSFIPRPELICCPQPVTSSNMREGPGPFPDPQDQARPRDQTRPQDQTRPEGPVGDWMPVDPDL